MRSGSVARSALAGVAAALLWLGSALPASAETPSPTPASTGPTNPFADLAPVSLLIWLVSALVALVAIVYAVERERRKHDG